MHGDQATNRYNVQAKAGGIAKHTMACFSVIIREHLIIYIFV